MANIISSIHLCSVPITPTHQLDFEDVGKQLAYFASKAVRHYDDCKYTPRTGKIRVKAYVDELNDCNYGYYINTYNGTTKTFYFFIDERTLIAPQTCELDITLDVFQTWMFDVQLQPCFIERQHARNDDIGSNTYPESFELGDYVTVGQKTIEELQGDPCYLFGDSDYEDGEMGGQYSSNFCGYRLRYFEYKDAKLLSGHIHLLCSSGKADSIAFMYSFPDEFLKGASVELDLGSGDELPTGLGWLEISKTVPYVNDKFSYKGISYTPFNNKLFTYPYNFVTVTNGNGSNVIYKYENFKNPNSAYVKIETCIAMNPLFTCTPENYCGKAMSYEDSISLQGYPLCSWNNDNFSNWYASNQHSLINQSTLAKVNLNTAGRITDNNARLGYDLAESNRNMGYLNTAGNSIGNIATGRIGSGVGGALTGGIATTVNFNNANKQISNDLQNATLQQRVDYNSKISTLMAQIQDSQVQPNTCKGDTTASGLDMARGSLTFYINNTQIKPEYARKIDMYFQMYGYKLNEIDTPNTKNRKKWNYVKTVNCVVSGNVPFTDKVALQEIYNNGITIWHGEEYMFNYIAINEIIDYSMD